MEEIKKSEAMANIMTECPECSSNSTIIEDNNLKCLSCGGNFVHEK